MDWACERAIVAASDAATNRTRRNCMRLASAACCETSTARFFCRLAADDRRDCGANSLHLRLSHHATEQLHEVRGLATGRDVLPAISAQHSLTDCLLLGRRESTLAQAHEVGGVGRSLTLQQMIQTGH